MRTDFMYQKIYAPAEAILEDLDTGLELFDQQPDGKIMIALKQANSTYKHVPFSDFLLTHEQDESCLQPNDDFISQPHSNAFIDLNGNCVPDILLGKTDK